MPALPPADSVLDLRYGFTIGEDVTAACRQFFFFTGSSPSDADLTTLAGSVASSFATNCLGNMTADRVLTSVTITDLSSPTSGRGEWTGSHAGADTGAKLPANAATLQSLHVARRYRGGHPRTYWPWGSESDLQDAQTFNAAYVTAATSSLHNHFADWSTDLPGSLSSVEPVNVSYYHGFTPHTGTTGRVRNVSTPRSSPILDAVTGFAVQAGIAALRKRLLRLA